ncbi:hypothetical protein [Sphingomonas sp.]|uniref:hypothetical protein n=1 Tax=Sphingomonas sp. TaxID=28214 RepID=UPI0025E59D09|nr:hypothetical protein [Sphingomonas sp.]
MSEQVRPMVPVRAYRFAGFSTFAVLATTAFHHAYGAIVYDTPWRLHVAVIAPILALAIARALYLGGSRRGTRSGLWWTRIAAAMILVFPVGLIGLVEGGYNHVIKNLVYFLSGPQAARALFPPPAYEMPDNFLFEITGNAQLPLALAAAYCAMALLRPWNRRGT